MLHLPKKMLSQKMRLPTFEPIPMPLYYRFMFLNTVIGVAVIMILLTVNAMIFNPHSPKTYAVINCVILLVAVWEYVIGNLWWISRYKIDYPFQDPTYRLTSIIQYIYLGVATIFLGLLIYAEIIK